MVESHRAERVTEDAAARYSVTIYFLAAFALTWVVWVPRALVQHGLVDWHWVARCAGVCPSELMRLGAG